jgi:hypothetical protein
MKMHRRDSTRRADDFKMSPHLHTAIENGMLSACGVICPKEHITDTLSEVTCKECEAYGNPCHTDGCPNKGASASVPFCTCCIIAGRSGEKWVPVESVLEVLRDKRWLWTHNMACKYVSLRVDTRDMHCTLQDREGNHISLRDLARQLDDFLMPAQNTGDADGQSSEGPDRSDCG